MDEFSSPGFSERIPFSLHFRGVEIGCTSTSYRLRLFSTLRKNLFCRLFSSLRRLRRISSLSLFMPSDWFVPFSTHFRRGLFEDWNLVFWYLWSTHIVDVQILLAYDCQLKLVAPVGPGMWWLLGVVQPKCRNCHQVQFV